MGNLAPLARHGRFGDTMLAHITTKQANVLKKMGGSGTINPNTGYREYFLGALLGAVAGPLIGSIMGSGKGSQQQQFSMADQAQAEAARTQADIARQQMQIGGEAATDLKATYKNFLDKIGNVGFSPANVDAIKGDYQRFIDSARTAGMGGKFAALGNQAAATNPALAEYYSRMTGGMGRSGIDLKVSGDASAGTQSAADRLSSMNLDTGYRTGTQDDTFGALYSGIYGDYKANADEQIGQMRSSLEAQLADAGLGTSGPGNDLRAKLLAATSKIDRDARSGARAEAMGITKERQGLDVASQNARLAGIDSTTRSLAAGSNAQFQSGQLKVSQEENHLQMQLAQAKINDAIARGDFEDAMNLTASMQKMKLIEQDNYFKNQAQARGDYIGDQTNYVDDYSTGYNKALSMLQSFMGLRGDEANFLGKMVTDPASLRAGIFNEAAKNAGSAGQTYGNIATRAGNNASNSAKTWGGAFDSFWKDSGLTKTIDDWSTNFFDSGGTNNTSSDWSPGEYDMYV